MRFKVKDLMISILPERQTGVVPPFIADDCGGTCTCTNSCTGNSCAVTKEIFVDPEDFVQQQLAVLKTRLLQALAQIEAQERAVEEQQRPQTLADVELLEQRMVEALEELRSRKEKLKGAAMMQENDGQREG